MTNVLVRLKVPGPGGFVGATGHLKINILHRDVNADFIVVPFGYTVELDANGEALLDLPPTSVSDAWVITEYVGDLPPGARVIQVPDSPTTVGYEDLPDIDPETLLPSTTNVAGWTSILAQVQDAADAVNAALDLLDPGTGRIGFDTDGHPYFEPGLVSPGGPASPSPHPANERILTEAIAADFMTAQGFATNDFVATKLTAPSDNGADDYVLLQDLSGGEPRWVSPSTLATLLGTGTGNTTFTVDSATGTASFNDGTTTYVVYSKTKVDSLLAAKQAAPTTGTASASTFLRGDGAWAVPPGSGSGGTVVNNGDGTGTFGVIGTGDVTTNVQAGGSYTARLADMGNVIEQSSNNILTVILPNESTESIPVGKAVELYLHGAGSIVIAGDTGVVLRSPGNAYRIIDQYGSAVARKRAANEWVIAGYTVV